MTKLSVSERLQTHVKLLVIPAPAVWQTACESGCQPDLR